MSKGKLFSSVVRLYHVVLDHESNSKGVGQYATQFANGKTNSSDEEGLNLLANEMTDSLSTLTNEKLAQLIASNLGLQNHKRVYRIYCGLELNLRRKGKRHFRTFSVIDDYNRESLAIEIYNGLPTTRVIHVLDCIADYRCYPRQLRQDNGPEFTAYALELWAEEHAVKLDFIKPRTPTQNAYIERFNRTYRNEVLVVIFLTH